MVNVRRPQPVLAESVAPLAEHRALDDAPLPPTALRLPDLSKLKNSFAGFRLTWKTAGEAAQWTGIGLGALLALWLIFGGRRGEVPAADAPAWTAPSRSQAEPEAPTWTPPAPEAPEAPRWQPSSAPAESASPAASGPYESSAPQLPTPDATGSMAGGPAARTAQRPDYHRPHVSGDSPPAEAQSLGITVPVPQ